MTDSTDAKIATADVLTLLLYNQHSLAAAIEDLALWIKANGGNEAHANALAAIETLDRNAQGITDAIMHLRQS